MLIKLHIESFDFRDTIDNYVKYKFTLLRLNHNKSIVKPFGIIPPYQSKVQILGEIKKDLENALRLGLRILDQVGIKEIKNVD